MVWWIQAKKLASLWQYHCCCQCFCCATTIRVRQGAVSSVCWMAFWEVSPKAQLMPGAWYSAGKGNYWTPATTGLTPSPSFFFRPVSRDLKLYSERTLFLSFETSFLMHSTSTNSLKNAAAPRYWGIPMALAFPEPQLCLLPSKICALFPLVPYMLLELGYL